MKEASIGNKQNKIAGFALAGILMAGSASAIFFQPDSVNADIGATYTGITTGSKAGAGESEFNRPPSRLINGSGMPASYDETTTIEAAHYNHAWLSRDLQPYGTVVFSFDTAVDIGSFVLWNNASDASHYSEGGINEFKIRFFDAAENLIGSEYSDFAVAGPTDGVNLTPENFTFSSLYEDVRHVEFEILSNHGGGNYIGAQEIGFTDVVPEPATVSMMALVAGLGFLIRRHFVA